jgi:hypothetical protein
MYKLTIRVIAPWMRSTEAVNTESFAATTQIERMTQLTVN